VKEYAAVQTTTNNWRRFDETRAEQLARMLNEAAREGWELVGIVPAEREGWPVAALVARELPLDPKAQENA
jgi:hypothetical protein